MAGNVFEWTGDWKAQHTAIPISNPIGSQEHNQGFERVIKGGSFEHDIFNLRPECRSATYSTSASSACEYVGFRCARGIIPAPLFVSSDTAKVSSNPADMTVSDMRPFLCTSSAKLVYVNVTLNRRTLCFIDYSEAHPQIREFQDMTNVYFPTISPDGKNAAFCTQNMGFGDSSAIYIRSLDSIHTTLVKIASDFAYMPRWWVNPSSKDTFIVFTNSAIDNGLAEWNGTKTFLQKMTAGKPAGSPEIIVQNGSFHDGVSLDGRYIASGYTKLYMKDLISQEQKQLFVFPLNGKPASGSTQVCNVSVSPDSAHPDRCLFLDFGSSSSTLVGGPYGVHQYLFIADFSGKVISWLKCPDNESSWDFPKWSPYEQFAVSVARNSSDESRSIYYIDFSKNTYRKIVAGVSLEHPYLWIGNIPPSAGGLDADSLGLYDDPHEYQFQNETAMKMEIFWKNYHDAQLFFLGSSQMANAIDCSRFTGFKAVNMGYAAGGMRGLWSLTHQYILPHCPQIRLIAFSVTPYWLCSDGADVSWNAGIVRSKGYQYDLHHNFWKFGKPAQFDGLITQASHYYAPQEVCGQAMVPCQNWGGDPNLANNQTWTLATPQVAQNFDTLQSFINDLSAQHIHFLVINFPESPAYKNTDKYSYSGLPWETGKAIMQKFASYETGNPYYHFYDAYKNGNHDYADSEALNWNHLCPNGAIKMSSRLDSLIHTFLFP